MVHIVSASHRATAAALGYTCGVSHAVIHDYVRLSPSSSVGAAMGVDYITSEEVCKAERGVIIPPQKISRVGATAASRRVELAAGRAHLPP